MGELDWLFREVRCVVYVDSTFILLQKFWWRWCSCVLGNTSSFLRITQVFENTNLCSDILMNMILKSIDTKKQVTINHLVQSGYTYEWIGNLKTTNILNQSHLEKSHWLLSPNSASILDLMLILFYWNHFYHAIFDSIHLSFLDSTVPDSTNGITSSTHPVPLHFPPGLRPPDLWKNYWTAEDTNLKTYLAFMTLPAKGSGI